MKYGIFLYYWTNTWSVGLEEYIDRASALGFDILELHAATLAGRYTTDEQLAGLKEYAEQKNIVLSTQYGPSKEEDLGSSDPAVIANAMSFYTDVFKKFKKAGIGFMGGGINSYWPVNYANPFDKKEDWKNSVKNLREMAKVAQEYDVTLGLEVLNRFEGYLLNTCAEALEFVADVGEPNVGLELDTFHMNIEEDSIPEAIRLAGDRLFHLHVGESNRRVPGKGNLPWREIGNALRDIDYQKNVVMEPFVLGGGEVGSDIKIWREIVSDTSDEALDRDAKGALDFLRHTFAK